MAHRPLHPPPGMPTGWNAMYLGYLEPRGPGRHRTQSAWFHRSKNEVAEEPYYDKDLDKTYNYGGGASRSAGASSSRTGQMQRRPVESTTSILDMFSLQNFVTSRPMNSTKDFQAISNAHATAKDRVSVHTGLVRKGPKPTPRIPLSTQASTTGPVLSGRWLSSCK